MADSTYQRLKTSRVVTRVRRLMDQIPFSTESEEIDSNVIGGPGNRFSSAELIELVNAAQRGIAQKVKACHIPNLISSSTSTTALSPVLRLLPNRVFYSVDDSDLVTNPYTRARRQKVDTRRRLKDPGRQATATYPIYTYEAGEMKVEPSGDVKWFYVTTPAAIDSVDVATGLNTELSLDERFECALVYYVASLAYQKLKRIDLHNFTFSIYEDELSPYKLDQTGSILKEREVEVE